MGKQKEEAERRETKGKDGGREIDEKRWTARDRRQEAAGKRYIAEIQRNNRNTQEGRYRRIDIGVETKDRGETRGSIHS